MSFNPEISIKALLQARKTHTQLASLPEGGIPESWEEMFAIQNGVAHALLGSGYGPIVAWKVGAPKPDGQPFGAAIWNQTFFENVESVNVRDYYKVGVEAEIVYRFGKTFLRRENPYTAEDILAAIATVHPAIELVDTRFVDMGKQTFFINQADQGSHGALIIGKPMENWKTLVPVEEPITLTINGEIRAQHKGGNSAGDTIRGLTWIVNHALESEECVPAGTAVTTGSTTGTIFVEKGSKITAQFEHVGTLSLSLPG
ncbi:2-keto-4-pentenoate hydratase [Entomobacter blattae]|uniref:2-keto-4-pentenoate hydratase n=1 Tax=Entomobacter blattae TaxID=2762277 RepID=A0A7H1NUA3_9PROT|nr:fumarylacetoacetate hydrolase family protein [Entomobacter blattae]QNT79363.1 2-keto-4-pentenoate hydratase [Entomobacter blattae]